MQNYAPVIPKNGSKACKNCGAAYCHKTTGLTPKRCIYWFRWPIVPQISLCKLHAPLHSFVQWRQFPHLRPVPLPRRPRLPDTNLRTLGNRYSVRCLLKNDIAVQVLHKSVKSHKAAIASSTSSKNNSTTSSKSSAPVSSRSSDTRAQSIISLS